MKSTHPQSTKATARRRGFTLVEIMIVVAIVGILSLIAVVAMRRIRDHAVRSAIQNNLRQLYQAKEFYFSDNGSGMKVATIISLASNGYLGAGTKARLMAIHSMEANLGWHYNFLMFPDKPAYAYLGTQSNSEVPPTGEVIYYPGPPKDLREVFKNALATASTATPAATVTPPATAKAPVATPAPTQPVAPAGPVLPPGNHNFGNIAQAGGQWTNDAGILWQMGVRDPAERSSWKIQSIQFSDPGITATKDSHGYWSVTGSALYRQQNAAFTITVTNPQGGTSTTQGRAPVR